MNQKQHEALINQFPEDFSLKNWEQKFNCKTRNELIGPFPPPFFRNFTLGGGTVPTINQNKYLPVFFLRKTIPLKKPHHDEIIPVYPLRITNSRCRQLAFSLLSKADDKEIAVRVDCMRAPAFSFLDGYVTVVFVLGDLLMHCVDLNIYITNG